ncbi:DUF4235 domain-containing protein [Streptomyces alkaliterrae]|uniref:DUF4235 domain-containing protein n=1 Tax=Streptomyces alkaliterrae TaxID=2213162 RepID=A0A5P0YPU2_9ACTN|nr:DUF4235 domain-containing protein [Streptomyces alkaliterrae]MBB1253321.1 DUF4235 domain-containing protein [Streptomyces alkaliterrae]MBB1259274.1 DUF4235 domain-containing protein [Streptomyces alkaliterrae]MQS02301.1 DUF4235 domain-containing protein [Streptomyces alkaliterrae]
MQKSKILYRPVGMVSGMVGGMLAGAAFRRLWRLMGHDDEAPGPMDEERGWQEVLLAAAVQGAVFALVKAAVDRGGATAVRRVTGTWPG